MGFHTLDSTNYHDLMRSNSFTEMQFIPILLNHPKLLDLRVSLIVDNGLVHNNQAHFYYVSFELWKRLANGTFELLKVCWAAFYLYVQRF